MVCSVLPSILQFVSHGMEDPDIHVRQSAYIVLGQLANHCQVCCNLVEIVINSRFMSHVSHFKRCIFMWTWRITDLSNALPYVDVV